MAVTLRQPPSKEGLAAGDQHKGLWVQRWECTLPRGAAPQLPTELGPVQPGRGCSQSLVSWMLMHRTRPERGPRKLRPVQAAAAAGLNSLCQVSRVGRVSEMPSRSERP